MWRLFLLLVAAPAVSLRAAPPRSGVRTPAGVRDESATNDFLPTLQREALPDLIRSIGVAQKKPRLRLRATQGGLQDRRAVPYLRVAYDQTDNEGVRCKLIQSLGNLRDPSLFNWYVRRLQDHSVAIRCFAAWALGELHTPRAAGPLRALIWSPERFVQMTAIDALGKTGPDPDVASELEPFLDHQDVQVRYLAAQALGGVGGPELTFILARKLTQETSIDVQEMIAISMGRAGGGVAVGRFIELLKNPPTQATEHWVEVGLRACPRESTTPALMALLDHSDARVRMEARRLIDHLEAESDPNMKDNP